MSRKNVSDEKKALAFWLAVAGSESPGPLDKLAIATEKEMVVNALNEALRIARTVGGDGQEEGGVKNKVYRKLKSKINPPDPAQLAHLIEAMGENVELAHEVAALAQSFILLADILGEEGDSKKKEVGENEE